MNSTAGQQFWKDTGPMLLFGGLLLPPLAWFLDLQTSYAMLKWACEHQRRDLVLAVPAASLIVVILAGALSWWSWIRVRNAARADGGRMEDRSYVLAIAGLGMSALFALLIATTIAQRALLSPCQ
jgi:hypothetical protein